jgi:hypothetical protein
MRPLLQVLNEADDGRVTDAAVTMGVETCWFRGCRDAIATIAGHCWTDGDGVRWRMDGAARQFVQEAADG